MTTAYKTWEEYTPLEQAACTWWDMYKDAYNFRPRDMDTSDWTLEKFEEEMQYLQGVIRRNEGARLEDEAEAAVHVEDTIAKMMESGCRNREMAIRWLHDIYETEGDTSYLEYNLGVAYGYFASTK